MHQIIKRALVVGVSAASVVGFAACEPGGTSGSGCGDGSYGGRDGGGGSDQGGDDGGGLEVVGLTNDQRLICFDEDSPDDVLYGLGNSGGVDTIDDSTARATLRSRMNVALQGNSFRGGRRPVGTRSLVTTGSRLARRPSEW